jgi:ADP-ribose pyrophosphatase
VVDDRPPFSRIEHTVLVANRWHRYCRDRYVRRDGSEGEYFYVDMPGSCGTVPLFGDGTTVLLRVRRYVLGCELWEFPIGGMAAGDDPLLVAKHELEEEAGLVAARWDKLGQFAPYKGVSNEVCHFFVARELRVTAQRLEAEEDIAVHRMPLAQARRLLLQAPLGDGQSLAGLLLLEQALSDGTLGAG